MTTSTAATTLDSPLGPLRAVASGDALVRLAWPTESVETVPEDAAPFRALRDWLDAYFAGATAPYDGPLAPAGTPFQQRVWALLREIPHGTTTTYGALATRLGDPNAVRAVGAANGRNPLALVVPCHRVVGAGGALTGFAGGLDAKRFLLALEARDLFAPLAR